MNDFEQIQAIKCNTLTQMADVSSERKPTYTEGGQTFSWTEYLNHLQQRVDWCNRVLAVEQPFEIETRGYVE